MHHLKSHAAALLAVFWIAVFVAVALGTGTHAPARAAAPPLIVAQACSSPCRVPVVLWRRPPATPYGEHTTTERKGPDMSMEMGKHGSGDTGPAGDDGSSDGSSGGAEHPTDDE